MTSYTIGASPKSIKACQLHTHSQWEIVMNLDGAGTAIIDGNAISFTAGTVMCIPPDTPHRKEAAEGFYDIYLHTDTLPVGGSFLCFQDDEDSCLGHLFRMLLRSHYRRDTAAPFLYHAILELLRSQYRKGIDPVEWLCDQMIRHFTDPYFRPGELLEHTGYTSDYMRRLFCARLGQTPNDYLQDLRLTFARELLAQKERSRLSIADIAHMCGFHDEKYFSRVFRKGTGETPLQYAKAPQRKDETT